MMKNLLCLLLIAFALSLVTPAAEATAMKARPTLVKATGKKNSKKHKKHRKHGRKHHKKAPKNKA